VFCERLEPGGGEVKPHDTINEPLSFLRIVALQYEYLRYLAIEMLISPALAGWQICETRPLDNISEDSSFCPNDKTIRE
jgi:hypothetical protein